MKLLSELSLLSEQIEYRRYQPGQVKFSKSQVEDNHIQQIAKTIAQAKGVTTADVFATIKEQVSKFEELKQKAPTLYETIGQNIVENELFNMFGEIETDPIGPKFSTVTFYKLIRYIKAEHDEFWPLRGFVDPRPLANPTFEFVNVPMNAKGNAVTTAAATPSGVFIFNIPFMQKLLDYANVKGIKPKGKKYKSNGGDIPDEYAYIEFLIMHEFMHYTHEDFYYQKIIPNANPRIINWVGDFRTNYLLVKSGYEQLPIGLFNDNINYDRQKEYVEMYRLVEEEFKKLSSPEQDLIQNILDKLSDDHNPGQGEGKKTDIDEVSNGRKITPDNIDGKAKQVEEEIKKGDDKGPTDDLTNNQTSQDGAGQPGKGKGSSQTIDVSQVNPSFSWKEIVKKFLSKAKPRQDETYTKPHRRSITGMEVARQAGAGAVKAGERAGDFTDAKLAFVFDSSGSMSSVIATVYSNALNLLKQPQFRKTQAVVYKFSGGYDIFKCSFADDRAAKVSDVKEKPKNFDRKTSSIFNTHLAGGTDFSAALAEDIKKALQQQYNVIFFLDGDIMWGSNYSNFLSVLQAAPKQVFVIFDSEQTYRAFRNKVGTTTVNITYFK